MLATTYYISPTGSDNNAGTSTTSPWKTISKVNSKAFAPGDKILFKGGSTFTGTVTLSTGDVGSSTSPITISSYGSGKATIYNTAGKGILVRIGGVSIDNIAVKGGGPSTTNYQGIHFQNTGGSDLNYVRVNNVEVSGWKLYGITVQGLNGSAGFNDVRVTNSKVFNNGTAGIRFDSANQVAHNNVYIGNNQVYSNPGFNDWSRPTGSGIQMSGVQNTIIEYNDVHDNGANANYGCGIWTTRSDRVTIQYNSSYNNRAPGNYDGGGFDFDGGTTNSVMQYNYSANNDGNGYGVLSWSGASTSSNNIIRYNIGQNDGRRNNQASMAVGANGPIRDLYIYNNVFVKNDSSLSGFDLVMRTHYNIPNLQIKNNIFYATSSKVQMANFRDNAGFDIKANTWYNTSGSFKLGFRGTTYTSLSSFANATGQEKIDNVIVGLSVNPKLVNAGHAPTVLKPNQLSNTLKLYYSLLSNSPVIGKGVSITFLSASSTGATHDFFGGSVSTANGNRLEMGVDEY